MSARIDYDINASNSIAMTVSILSGGHPHPMPRGDNRKKSASCHPLVATTIYKLRNFVKNPLRSGYFSVYRKFRRLKIFRFDWNVMWRCGE